MTEFLGVAGRMVFLLGALGAVGSAGFLLLAPTATASASAVRAWRQMWFWRLGFFPLLIGLGLALQLLAQALTLMGPDIAKALHPQVLEPLLRRTNFGWVWSARLAAMFLLGLFWVITLGMKRGDRRFSAAPILVLAGLAAMIGPLAGHSSGAESPPIMMSLNALHILAAGLWAGALPCWVSWARLNRVQDAAPNAIDTVRRFSTLAAGCVVVLLLSGVWLADEFVEHLGDLLGTRYGLLIVVKVGFFAAALLLANRIRHRLLEMPKGGGAGHSGFFAGVVASARGELLAVLLVVIAAGALAQTTPAIHDQPVWFLPFRVSPEAAWDAWPEALYGGLYGLLALLALGLWGGGRVWKKPLPTPLAWGLLPTVLVGGIGALYWFSVPAYPDTYRRSDVPYLAASVVQGQLLFEQHCVSCHGSGGLGDGKQAAYLPVPPADLSEPHTSLHTAGDMYWWFTHGIPQSGMPGFAGKLSEQDRWDLVNFLRAFSRGFEARVLRDVIVPRDPWLGAPNFYFDSPTGYSELKALRESHTALLVFADYANPQSQERLAALDRAQPRLQQAGLQILVVPINPELSEPALPALQIVRNEARPIWATYSLLSRSLADRGDDDALGVQRTHVEFLVDRFGYLRARWIPGESTGWTDIERLLMQVRALMAEPEIEPPPDDHVH